MGVLCTPVLRSYFLQDGLLGKGKPLANVLCYQEFFFISTLKRINDLNNISSISENLYISNNPVLVELAGFTGMTKIGGGLYLYSDNALTDEAGLNRLSSIAGNVSIWNNAALVHLTGLSSITTIGGGLIHSIQYIACQPG